MEPLKTVRGLSGFGDSIYLLAAVQQLFKKNEVLIYTNYPDVFKGYKTLPFMRAVNIDYDFSYLFRKGNNFTNQWEDMLLNAGIEKDIPFKLSTKGLKKIEGSSELIAIDLYPSFGNGKGRNQFMIPKSEQFYEYVQYQKVEYKSFGYISHEIPFKNLCEIFYTAKKIICQQGWGTALAEALDIPCDVIFCKRALTSDYDFIKRITPKKVLTKKTSTAVILD